MPTREERGFAIPVTVLLIALITVMLTSGFVRVRADRQVAESQEVSAEALSIARAGLGAFFDAHSTRPSDGITDTLYVTGGYAIVNANVVQNPPDTLASQTWVVRSTGYVIDVGTGATPRARRNVAQFAEWQSGAVNVRGSLTVANGIQYRNRGRIYIDGNDACSEDPAVPGFRTAGTIGVTPGARPSVLQVSGSPDSVNQGMSGGPLVAIDTDIDWSEVINGGIVADYYGNVPNYDFSYPITYVDGDYTPSGYVYGSGLLIVRGDFEPSSWVWFQGLVLVGGRIRLDGFYSSFQGAVVTGLNEQLGINPQQTILGWSGGMSYDSYQAHFIYNSCEIDAALEGLIGFAPIDNAWVDNWATY